MDKEIIIRESLKVAYLLASTYLVTTVGYWTLKKLTKDFGPIQIDIKQ